MILSSNFHPSVSYQFSLETETFESNDASFTFLRCCFSSGDKDLIDETGGAMGMGGAFMMWR